MASLDDRDLMKHLDPKQMATHIAELPDQIELAGSAFRQVAIPTHYVQAKNILILGMGGSAIGGELAAELAAATSHVPITVRRDYGIPGYINKDSLVIAVSYSGNTEETIDGFLQAARRGAKLLAITTGGDIASLARKFQVPIFSIDYGSQPRAALGYLFTAVITILAKLRHIELGSSELEETAVLMRGLAEKIGFDVPTKENVAKTLATKLKDRLPMIIGSGIMATVGKRWKTQLNENGKLTATTEILPEMCHNVIVGMQKIYRQRDWFLPIFLGSAFSHPRNQLRMSILSQQFTKSRLPSETVMMHPSGTPLSEALQMVLFGDYLSYYVAIQANTDPTSIGPISELKNDLAANQWEPGK